jgi:spore photoproduct lyase
VKRYRPQKIIVDRSVSQLPFTRKVLNRLEGVPVEYISQVKSVQDEQSERLWSEAQRTLLVCRNRGRFFEPCPGTSHYLCCGYHILNFGTNCNINCTYCILQVYLNNPFMVLYANTGEMLKELDRMLTDHQGAFYRVGTGEYTDSLLLDHLTSLTQIIVPRVAAQHNAILELKTKTDIIENLEGLKHRGNTVVSWSLNAEPVIRQEEKNACSLDARLQAARQCQQWGYKIGFHFDPLIYYPGWEKDYAQAVEKLFQKIDPASICWISLGCFRFIPQLKSLVKERYPESRILYQEFVKGLDGKMRYFKPIRIEMYSAMADWIRRQHKKAFIYLCMESSEVWEQSLGFAPRSRQELRDLLDRQCSS